MAPLYQVSYVPVKVRKRSTQSEPIGEAQHHVYATGDLSTVRAPRPVSSNPGDADAWGVAAEAGGDDGTRTHDPLLAKQVL